MLILVVGITGNLGHYLAEAALKYPNVQVRGLGRSPSKLSSSLQSSLESFVTSTSWYDVPALERACSGVDAVICAYTGIPALQLEAQLLLLRAADQAGVKVYHASSWNYDWRRLQLGEHESYDPFIAFHRHTQLDASISLKPIFSLIGVFAEVLFGCDGHVNFSPKNHGIWDRDNKYVEYYGTGDEKYQWTTERDAAEFTIAIVLSELEKLQGQKMTASKFFCVCSGEHSLKEIAAEYHRVKGVEVTMVNKGTVQDLERIAPELRAKAGDPQRYWEYIGAFYQLYTINGRYVLREPQNSQFPNVKTTSLTEFMEQHSDM